MLAKTIEVKVGKRVYGNALAVGVGFKVFLAVAFDDVLFEFLDNVYFTVNIVDKAVAAVEKSLLHTAETSRLYLEAVTLALLIPNGSEGIVEAICEAVGLGIVVDDLSKGFLVPCLIGGTGTDA